MISSMKYMQLHTNSDEFPMNTLSIVVFWKRALMDLQDAPEQLSVLEVDSQDSPNLV